MIDTKEYRLRRKRLMDMIGTGSVAIIPTSPVYIRNRDVEFPFRPDSDFFYLTGYPEPEAVVVLIPDREHGEFILFCRENNAEMETWHGRRAGLTGAINTYAADDAFPIEDMDDILPGLLEGHERIFYNIGNDSDFDNRIFDWIKQIKDQSRAGGTVVPSEFISPQPFLHDMRLYKSRNEIALMRKAAKISAAAHKRAISLCKPGMYEYQLEAELIHEFMHRGAVHVAYPSIVASGRNTCILHYTENKGEIVDGDLLLIDAGAEYHNYASDITRTFPANGKFSEAQRQVYELVLKAQYAAIAEVKPGNHWNQPHDAVIEVLTAGLLELGILNGDIETLRKEQAYKKYYMHRTGHWLGMDVHDVGDYKVDDEWRTLEPGMVLTIEPGLYLSAETKGLEKKWWDIGVRIEDDVLVTKDGHEVLSKGVTKCVDEIEALMSHAV